ncbi:cellulase family glycosylhydrolase [Hwangdonia seohaensis]|uniref:Cellulase family glycosylhydrolase n=1 Tax=Hwangdonia seohaensis TaxID=1240727 RepID=A0ABW3RDN0_9FLAO|nr:cellulase family glycosylhydrolase [Hwangdonia seohaensis]
MKMKKIMLFRYVFITILTMGLFVSCEENATPKNILPETITIKGDKFVDEGGREIILNGINIVSKNKEEGYIFQSGPELYENLKKWGVNCIRFIIIWDGLEPEPGVYNEAYLKEIDKRIQWAEQNNIFVVLDMHQDLFSVKYSDGAPEWATLDEGKPHTEGAIWSDAYMLSEAVQTAFDNFWQNKPASDGIGIQDRYAALWQHIAKRYADNSTVIGYDIMNEPFPGSSGVQSTMVLLSAYGQLHYKLTGEVLTEKQLGDMWSDEKGRMEALKILSNRENYHFVFSQLFELNRQFEVNHLQNMYQKVSAAIREVDTKHILFLEHSYYSNTGVASSIERTTLADGEPDPLVAYAPHGYDLVTDTDAVANASNERVAYIYDQIKSKGEQLKMPVWLGEWGAFYGNSESVIPAAKNAISLIEKHLFGNAYWSYDPGTGNLRYFNEVLVRSYPVAVNGTLLNYKNNFDEKSFEMHWEEDVNNQNSTIIFVPQLSKLSQTSKEQIPNLDIKTIPNGDSGWLLVPPLENPSQRTINIQFD